MMRRLIDKLIVYGLCIGVLPLSAQTSHGIICKFETAGLTGVGDHAPFWHTSVRQGLPGVKTDNGYMHMAALGTMQHPSGLGVDYGLDMGIGTGLQTDCFIHQLYIDLGYKWIGMSVGMKERRSDKNPSLSTGGLTWSGNSRPIPEICAGIPDYVHIPLLGEWVSVKGHISYGRLTDDKWRQGRIEQDGTPHVLTGVTYADGVLYHSKSLFFRFGNLEIFPLQFIYGLEMNNIFGGSYYISDVEVKLPSDFATYRTVLLPFHHVEDQGSWDGDNYGSWHMNLDYVQGDWLIRAYYEHFFEDHSSMLGVEYKNNINGEKDYINFGFRRNWLDGLYGIEFNAPDGVKFLRNVVVEFLNTRGLCGPIRHSVNDNVEGMQVVEEVDGIDDMYNHSIYISDTHWGYTMGNPVLISPVYNSNGSNRLRSNRVQMFHLGVDGGITDNIDYRFMATTTQHWGCYGTPLKEVERVTSLMLECSYRLGDTYGWKFTLSGAMDIDSGDLLGDNKGIMLTVSKLWKVL